MRRFFLVLLIAGFSASVVWPQTAAPVKVIYPTKFDKSLPLSEMVKKAKHAPAGGGFREIPNRPPVIPFIKDDLRPDPLLQKALGFGFSPLVATLQSFDGASNDDNSAVLGVRLAPPDPNLDVGQSHVVQMINLLTTIWDKSGVKLMGPFPNDDLWAGFGGDCEFNNDGDPIVIYDHIANRWILSQFVFSSKQCIACSETSDPTGAYFRYEFSTPGNDYPKLGLWPDAYYMSIRNFSGAFNLDAAAIERDKILLGQPAGLVILDMSALLAGIDGFLPADLDGPTLPPAGAPGIFMGHQDSPNRLSQFNMAVNWSGPSASLSGPFFIPVAAYDGVLRDIPQPGTTTRLDELAAFTMFRLAYRNMGTHEVVLANHTVDLNNPRNHAGIRWHEARRTPPSAGASSAFSLFQEGTYGPDAHHRWMGSAAMDKNGAIALAYTVSSGTVSPSIRFTGRFASDPAGQMTVTESSIVAGTGSQLGTNRWGDYSDLTVDPVDDETFWFTHEYVKTTGTFNWWTRVASFKLAGSPPPPPPPPPPATTTRINSGGPNFTSGGGNLFVADKAYVAGSFGFVGGQPKTFSNAIANTTDDALYQAIRRTTNSGASFEYKFDVPSGAYSVTLHLMAPTGGGTGNFIMNVLAEGATVFSNLDINSEAGGTFSALIKTFSASVTDGTLNLNFVKVNKGAIVCGIEVAPTTAPSFTNESSSPLGQQGLASVPTEFRLFQNHPNPFNPSTRIRYQLPSDMLVTLKVYNTLGEEVRTLVAAHQNAGSHEVIWDGKLASGARAASGVYLYRLQGSGFSEVRRMMLVQ